MTRGTALSRAIRYFEEGDLREIRVAFQIVKETVEGRLGAARVAKPVARRTRKAKPNGEAAAVAASKDHESLASA